MAEAGLEPEALAPSLEIKKGKRQPFCRPHSLVEVGLLRYLLTPLQGIGVLVLQALQVRHGPHALDLQPLVVRIQPVVGPGPYSKHCREHTDRNVSPPGSHVLDHSSPAVPNTGRLIIKTTWVFLKLRCPGHTQTNRIRIPRMKGALVT